jgi:hypothetical protein
MPTDRRTLLDIERQDPDGWTREPTDADRAAFRDRVIATYGEQTWRDYRRSGWDDPDV